MVMAARFSTDVDVVAKCGSLAIKSVKFKKGDVQACFEFEKPKEASLFALHFLFNYFPTDENVVSIPYAYDNRYVCGLSSLDTQASCLKDRKAVFLVDLNRIGFQGESGTDKSKRYNKNVILAANNMGYRASEIAICYTYGGEALYNIIAGFSLRKKGYVVFPEGTLDLFLTFNGVPDLVVVKLGAFQDKMIEQGIIEHGAWLAEFELQSVFGKCKRKGTVKEEKAIAVEGESASKAASAGHKQLDAYVRTGHFDFGVLVCPGRSGDEKYYPDYGYITWSDEGREISYFPTIHQAQREERNETLSISKKLITLSILKSKPIKEWSARCEDKTLTELIESLTKGTQCGLVTLRPHQKARGNNLC